MEDVLKFVRETFAEQQAVFTACCVVIVTLLLFLILFGRRSAKDTVLLVGLCDSGKTALFTLLTKGEFKATHTSIVENKEHYVPSKGSGGKSLLLIDSPGHQRIRGQYIERYSNQVGSIVFMIDSANFSRELRDVAECMYDVLATKDFMKSKCPILICCNKQDIPTARAKGVIKTQLETELTALRQTRAAALRGTDDQSSQTVIIGKKNKPFEFSHLPSMKTTFIECSVKGENQNPDISAIQDWLRNV